MVLQAWKHLNTRNKLQNDESSILMYWVLSDVLGTSEYQFGRLGAISVGYEGMDVYLAYRVWNSWHPPAKLRGASASESPVLRPLRSASLH